ncbi:hypothetical protein Plo01_17070 [Planobispora longispora]|uniref:Uncharacterized protein n=1 Tax=Planobispora longispora TaxID=28887 RepID=A0A8J3RHZ7_9ACTN|nr:hypothetical protein GCM10020093_076230 [Planobispora longispora]GIH75278.1 hypothetical protein Plo01_17070 [Planobispora longispora]
MTEPTETPPPYIPGPEPDDHVVFVRTLGSTALVGGMVLSFGILLFDGDFPSWPWLVGLWFTALIGLGLRLEVALREQGQRR